MKYLSMMGALYRMSDRNWRRLCIAGAHGNSPEMASYDATLLDTRLPNITDWTPEDFAVVLKGPAKKRKKGGTDGRRS